MIKFLKNLFFKSNKKNYDNYQNAMIEAESFRDFDKRSNTIRNNYLENNK